MHPLIAVVTTGCIDYDLTTAHGIIGHFEKRKNYDSCAFRMPRQHLEGDTTTGLVKMVKEVTIIKMKAYIFAEGVEHGQ